MAHLKRAAPESIQRGHKGIRRRANPGWVRSRAAHGLIMCLGHGAADDIETVCGHHQFGGDQRASRCSVTWPHFGEFWSSHRSQQRLSESRCSRSDSQSLWITTTLYASNCGPPINIGGPVLAFSATELVLLPEGGRRTSVMQSGQQAGALAGPQPLLALLERRPSPASCLHQSVLAPS